MIVVTGAAGFIGSNIVKRLNQQGRTDILAVDDLKDGTKFVNLVDLELLDYIDKDNFLVLIKQDQLAQPIDAIFHQGACSTTTEWDGQYMMNNNYEYSKTLLYFCLEQKIPFLYASSAAVYGSGQIFKEQSEYEAPLNVYGYSKFLFDQLVRRVLPEAGSQIVGLRYFNVYGPGEQHKGSMASVAFHLNNQMQENGIIKLFAGCDGYADGEQRRDFIYIDDVANVNAWLFQRQHVSGIFNLGTGRSQTFNDVAHAVLNWYGRGELVYVPFPDHLRGRYQSFTEANMNALRAVGCDHEFYSVEQGVKAYLDQVNA